MKNRMAMNRIYIFFFIMGGLLLAACQKDNTASSLPAGSISIAGVTDSDTLVNEVGIDRDTFVTVNLHATLEGKTSARDHFVTFRADTTLLSTYRFKYGNATLLPLEAYYFFRSQVRIPAGASVSDSMQLNIVSETKLKPKTLYVLPVVIRDIDGATDAVTPGQIVYVLVKTGAKPGVDRDSWSIVSASSVNSTLSPPSAVLDDDVNTFWASLAGEPMPQYLVIDFGDALTFSGVSYSIPNSFLSQGGYPRKVKIEVSPDGNTWTDKGTYDGVSTSPLVWKQSIGTTTARYLRFTVLEAYPFSGGYPVVLVGNMTVVVP